MSLTLYDNIFKTIVGTSGMRILVLYHGSFKPSNQISQFGVNKSLIHRLGGEYFLPVA